MINNCFRIVFLLLVIVTRAMSQEVPDLTVNFVATKAYPSLRPVALLRVHTGAAIGVNESYWTSIGFRPGSSSSYSVVDARTRNRMTIRSLEFPIVGGGPDYTLAYLELDASARNGDSYEVSLLGTGGTPVAKMKSPVVVKGFQTYSFNLNPQAAPGESLTSGAKRDVGQLNVSMGKPDLLGWSFARTYVETTDLYSTDERDSKSKFEATAGIERSLTPAWYVPMHVESKVQGDQTAQNLSYLSQLGLQTVLPWHRLKAVLYNPVLQIPVSPVISLDGQYERRINQDTQSKKKFPDHNDFRLKPTIAWVPIRFLPGLIGQDSVDVELNLKGWYLPFDQTKPAGRQRFEGYGDASVLIPLSRLTFLGPALTFLTSNDPNKARIRVKYSAGANDANGFKHFRLWSYGIEVNP